MAKAKDVVPAIGNEVVPFDATKYKVVGRIVVPSISLKKLKTGESIYFRAESELTEKQASDEVTNEPKMDDGKPVMLHVLNVTMLDTGQFGQIVVGAIAASGFKEAVARTGALIGRLFAMQKGEETKGKATKWDVVEIMEE